MMKRQTRIPLENDEEYTFHPIKRPMLAKQYWAQQNIRWVKSDVKLNEDRDDFDRLPPGEKTLVKGILAFFVFADGLVSENIMENFQKDTSFWKECRMFYAEQNAMEWVHAEVYSEMAKVLVRDNNELESIFNAMKEKEGTKKIAEFMKKYMDRKYTLLERILAFACIEGILFNGAFAPIYWLKKRNVLRGFTKANEMIARDESIHFIFAVTLFILVSMRDNEPIPSKERIYEIIRESVEVNRCLIKEILPVSLIGIDANSLLDYIKCCADVLSTAIGYEKIYNVENPFVWMAIISLPNKTNFFEDNVSEYTMSMDSCFVFDENIDF